MHQSAQLDLAGLVDRHLGEVYAYAAYRLAPDTSAVDDIVQDTFAAATRDWPALADPANAKAWLLQIARHKIADFFRANARERLQQPISPSDWNTLPQPQRDGDSDRAQAKCVAQAMQCLADVHRESLEDKYILGLSVRAMAAKHATTEKAIESALSRARDAFRQVFKQTEQSQESSNEQLEPR